LRPQEFAEALKLPTAGSRSYADLEYNNRGIGGNFWSSTSATTNSSTDKAYTLYIYWLDSINYNIKPQLSHNISYGNSIRCLMNDPKTLTFSLNG
jgi:hypothetical protein